MILQWAFFVNILLNFFPNITHSSRINENVYNWNINCSDCEYSYSQCTYLHMYVHKLDAQLDSCVVVVPLRNRLSNIFANSLLPKPCLITTGVLFLSPLMNGTYIYKSTILYQFLVIHSYI